MNKDILILILFLGFLINNPLNAQNYLPGVTEQIFNSIDQSVKTNVNEDLFVSFVLNVDSSLGFCLGLRWPDVEIIEDPNDLLTDSYVFLASRIDYISGDSTGGIIGIYKNSQIIWYSDDLIKRDLEVLADYVLSIKDINRDGNVEIMTTWTSRNSYDIWSDGSTSKFMFLWIISWDGTDGEALNSLDSDGNSGIKISSRGIFRLADVEGDGIWEIQGYAFPENSEDSLQVNEENGFGLKTFSWNGSLYGLWANTPQPYEDDTYPRNDVDLEINSSVISSDDSLVYSYYVKNLQSSYQAINEVALKVDENLSDNLKTIDCWRSKYRSDSTAMVLWAYSIDCYNFIKIGKADTAILLKLPNNYLPTISSFFASGWNTDNYGYNDIFINSVQQKIVSPSITPSPFVPLNFLNTLLNYKQRSFELGWITNQVTADKYDSLFTTAKTLLEGNHIPYVESTLHTVLEEVNEDSSENITSEAYALLRYNTEYLLNNLPEVIPPVLTSISPAILLRNILDIKPSSLTVTATGENFSDSSIVYFNGNVKTTTVISDTVLTFPITGQEMSTLGNYPVWISTYGFNSDTLVFSVTDNLPQLLTPTLQCVHDNGNHTYTAYFGYDNNNSVSIYIAIGNKNKFSPTPIDRGQPKLFLPGNHANVFGVIFNGSNLTWILDQASVTANRSSTPCP